MDSAFDIRLIKEFEKVRAFYDRSDPCFKNKTYINQMWENIATSLGFNCMYNNIRYGRDILKVAPT